jgi:hypothetical protein
VATINSIPPSLLNQQAAVPNQKGRHTHGTDQKTNSSTTGRPSVAPGKFSIMTGRNTTSHAARPALASHQSSSMPSTPHQTARRDFGSRSPSPNGLGGRSPRSVVSESNGYHLPKGRPACKYEGVLRLTSRRRMQYDIGDAPLDPPVVEPKQTLTTEEDKKLTKQIQSLYEKLLPTSDSEDRRKRFIKKLERILQKEWPGVEFTVDVFGSSGNMLCTTDSDGKTPNLSSFSQPDL